MAGRYAGRSGHRFRQIKANLRAQRRPCCLCGQPIDYSLSFPHPDSFSTQHIKDWATHPELREDPANVDAAHLICNQQRKTHTIGDASCDW